MHQALHTLTKEIREAARDLRRSYEPARLYELRVAIRRIRSMLKHRGSKRARRLRKTWGSFAAATNRARDWDVFSSTAESLLSPAALDEFRRACGAPLQTSRDRVIRMLESERWRAHLKEWKRFLARALEHSDRQDGDSWATALAGALDAALARARVALVVALQEDDDTSWHKFRIAVKEVRYTAEREPPVSTCGSQAGEPRVGESGVGEVVEVCKGLQSLLGGWHDCVIQFALLDELAPSPLTEELRSTIVDRRRQRLADIRETVILQPLFSWSTGPTPLGDALPAGPPGR
jgi:CHAD domain-containing protein